MKPLVFKLPEPVLMHCRVCDDEVQTVVVYDGVAVHGRVRCQRCGSYRIKDEAVN